MIHLKIKPLSVNEAWQGRRFKTPKYKAYEEELLYRLPNIELPEPPYQINFQFGLSNRQADYDNCVKALQDVMQKKYGFNDRDIYRAVIEKVFVKKGEEFFKVKLEHLPT